jgi:N utilization substance protein B
MISPESSEGLDAPAELDKLTPSDPVKSPVNPAKRVAGGRNARRRSREFAVQGLYQWLLSGSDLGVIQAGLVGSPGYGKCDTQHLADILAGVIRGEAELHSMLAPHLDRKLELVSPVERAILLIGAFELRDHPEIPYRVVINEAIDLAKVFGGTDGFRFVNGILDRVAVSCGVNQGRR